MKQKIYLSKYKNFLKAAINTESINKQIDYFIKKLEEKTVDGEIDLDIFFLYNLKYLDDFNGQIIDTIPYLSCMLDKRGKFIKRELVKDKIINNDYLDYGDIKFGEVRDIQRALFGEVYLYSNKPQKQEVGVDLQVKIMKEIVTFRNDFFHKADIKRVNDQEKLVNICLIMRIIVKSLNDKLYSINIVDGTF